MFATFLNIDHGSPAILTVLAGLVAGVLHVFMGPDHLAAVAPLSAHRPRRAWLLGLHWGLGHALGVGVIAIVAFLLRRFIPLETLSGWSERAVGAVLILVGLWGFRHLLSPRLHVHEHRHGRETHQHLHLHGSTGRHDPGPAEEHSHGHAAFAVGTLHGAAGSHHLVSLLPALALPSTLLAAFYLLAFALGNILGMILFAGLAGTLFARLRDLGMGLHRALLAITSSAAIALGIFWILS